MSYYYDMGYTPDGFRGPDGLIRSYVESDIVWVDAKTMSNREFVKGSFIVLYNSTDPMRDAAKLSGVQYSTKIGVWDKKTMGVTLIKACCSWHYKLQSYIHIHLSFKQHTVERF